MDTEKIGLIEAICLVLGVMVNHIILDLPKIILSTTGSAAPLNVMYICVLAIFFFLIINKLTKPFHNHDIIDISEYLGGNKLKVFLCIIYFSYLIFICGMVIRNFAESLKIIYFENMPVSVIILGFVAVACIANRFSFKTITKANLITLPLVLISIIVIFASTVPRFIPQRALPILGYGINETFFTGASNIFAFGGLLTLCLIMPNLKNKKDYKKLGITSIILSGIFLLLSVCCLLFVFPYITTGEKILSIYLSTRNVELGRFFQRADAIFILTWILSILSYLSIVFMYITKIGKKALNLKYSSGISYLVSALVFIVSLIPKNVYQVRFLENIVYKYCSLIIVVGFTFLILLFAYLKHRKENINKVGEINNET